MKMAFNGVAAAVFVTAAAGGAFGAVTIADWDLNGQPGSQASLAANSAAPNITGNTLSRGAGLTGSAGANSMNASGWTGDATDYYSFGFTVGAGYQVDLNSLYIGTRSSNTGPGTIGLYYNGDGFASAITTFNQAPGSNFVNTIVNLSALPNLSGIVEFRLAAIGSTAANGGATSAAGTFRVTAYFVGGIFDHNLGFSGEVIPTPGSATLAALGVAAMGMRPRRR